MKGNMERRAETASMTEVLESLRNDEQARQLQRFFKTKPGEYGEGDIFLGIRVPVLRGLVRQFRSMALKDLERTLQSPFHEMRLLTLFVLVVRSQHPLEAGEDETIFRMYLRNTEYINNWDLVDSSAEHIVGRYLENRERSPLNRLAKSTSLWERRIAAIACFYFIKRNDFTDILRISELLLTDREDLIHKAVGWMLREAGNRNQKAETDFLDRFCRNMPRTMLRYAIEKFPEEMRQYYLNCGKKPDVR